jgi:hypothetical protein
MSEDEQKSSATTEKTDAPAAPSSRVGFPAWVVGGVALLLLVAYGFFTNVMLGFAEKNTAELNWDRALLLFRSVESLAFAAAGVILGAQIQRSQMQQA